MAQIIPSVFNAELLDGISAELSDPALLGDHLYREFFPADIPGHYQYLHRALGRIGTLGRCFGIPKTPTSHSMLVWHFKDDLNTLRPEQYNGDIHRDLLRKRVVATHSSTPHLLTSTVVFEPTPGCPIPGYYSLESAAVCYLESATEDRLHLVPYCEQPEELRFCSVSRALLGGAVVLDSSSWHCVLPPPAGTVRATFSSTDVRAI